jgi:ABC-type dipeptide/oligopeptide/nickel transport systems, permease components
MGRRLLTGFLAVLIVLVLNFLLIHLAPGDPVRIIAGTDNPSPEMIEALQEKYGLDQPLHVQFGSYLKNLLRGDLGTSITYNRPVIGVIMERMGASLLLALTSAILALVLGTLLGLLASRHSGSWLDRLVSSVSQFFYAMPSFWLGLMAILIFSSWLKLLPTSGMEDMRQSYTGVAHVLDVARHMILPVGTLTLIQIPVYMRIFRSSVTQVETEEFVTTFRAAGMSERRIFNRYVFRNAILPTVTIFGIHLAYIVTGEALIEIVFAWPGIGRLMLDAIMSRDYPLLMGIYIMLSVAVAVVMLLLDLVYVVLDPRIRY